MKRADNSQTRDNILTFCAKRRIMQRLQFSEDLLDNLDRSRAIAVDPDGLFLRHIKEHQGDWTEDSGDNHNGNGIDVRVSYRSRTSPSLQACVKAARGGQYDYILELDLDEHNPFDDLKDFIGHAAEMLQNTLQRKRTDPAKIAKMLAKASFASA
jgi:hypothetical protein